MPTVIIHYNRQHKLMGRKTPVAAMSDIAARAYKINQIGYRHNLVNAFLYIQMSYYKAR